MRKLSLTLFMLFFVVILNAQNGSTDPAFGNNGTIITPSAWQTGRFQQIPQQAFTQSDGKILIAVGSLKASVSRKLPNGLPDSSYGHNGVSEVVSMTLSSAAMQTDGKIVIAGINQTADYMLARFNGDGRLDVTFGNNGVIITDMGPYSAYINAIAITADNKIIVAGSNWSDNGLKQQFLLMRYTSLGSPDNSFGTNGKAITDFNGSYESASSLFIQTDGKILVAGTSYGGSSAYVIARYLTDGKPDITFNGNGKLSVGVAMNGTSITAKNDKIYIGGYYTDFDTWHSHFFVARYNTDGTPDLQYNEGSGTLFLNFSNNNEYLRNIRLLSDGSLIASGTSQLNDNPTKSQIAIVHITTEGKLDKSFGNDGLVLAGTNAEDENNFLLVQSDDKILTGGNSYDYSTPNNFRYSCFRFNKNGTPDYLFGTQGFILDFIPGSYFNYVALHQQQDGKLLTASLSNDGINGHSYITRFNSNGSPDESFAQNGKKEIPYENLSVRAFQSDGKFVEAGYSPENDGNYYLKRYNQDATLDQTFGVGGKVVSDFGGSETLQVIAFQSDGKIIAGGLTNSNVGSDWIIVRYNVNGTVDASFGTQGIVRLDYSASDFIQAIAVSPDAKIVIAGKVMNADNTNADGLIVRLNTNGTFDQSFGTGGIHIIDLSNSDNVGTLAVQQDLKPIFTFWTSPGNGFQTVCYLTRLKANGTTDSSFGINGKIQCDYEKITLQADQKILVSGYKFNNQNNTDFILSRFLSNGLHDASFGNNGIVSHSFLKIDNDLNTTLLTDEKLFVAGKGTDEYGLWPGIIAKLNLDQASPIVCPKNIIVPTDKNKCSAKVNGIDPTLNTQTNVLVYRLTGATKKYGKGSASGQIFNKGVTNVVYTLSNDSTKFCSFTVTVEDKEAPAIDKLSANIETLWPADRRMKDVELSYSVYDNCAIADIKVEITSNEPVQSSEQGDQSPDWQIIDNRHVRLRAEKLKNSEERVYTIKLVVVDVSGNKSEKSIAVNVAKPRNQNCTLSISADPNPTRNYFRVSVSSSCNTPISLRVTDFCGRSISIIQNITSPSVIKMGEKLRPGVYYLEAIQGDNKKVIKLLKL